MKSDEIRIGTPCTVDWDAMQGCGARRFCGQCRKQVTDLSQLTEREARKVVAKPDQCVRYSVTARGDVLFAGTARRTTELRRTVGARLLALAAVLSPVSALAGGAPAEPAGGLLGKIAEAIGLVDPEPTYAMMGDIAMLQPPAKVTLENDGPTALSVDCGPDATVEPGASASLLVHEYSICTVTAKGADGATTTWTLDWTDHERTCARTADGLSCTRR